MNQVGGSGEGAKVFANEELEVLLIPGDLKV